MSALIRRNFAEEIEEARIEERRELARNLAEKAKFSYEDIAFAMNITVAEVQTLLAPRK